VRKLIHSQISRLISINSYVFNAWVPLLAYPTGEAPLFKVGYKINAAFWGIYLCGIPIILWFSKKFPLVSAPEQQKPEGEYPEEEEKRIESKRLGHEVLTVTDSEKIALESLS
jgi:hypothetical protein